MLVDDNPDDNFFHEREIRKYNPVLIIISKSSGMDALNYLKSRKATKEILPDLIFLDINMPGMNGWDFLHEYNLLDDELQSQVVIIMLTTSDNPDDISRLKNYRFVSDYIIKPLVKDKIIDIINKYFTL